MKYHQPVDPLRDSRMNAKQPASIVPPPLPVQDENLDCQPPDTSSANAESGCATEQQNVFTQLQNATSVVATTGSSATSKDELAAIFEGFARVLRADQSTSLVSQEDHLSQMDEMKELLLEAQETIINLLNDRVADRAQLAKLESEMRLVPDLQAQATKALHMAAQSEEVQKSLDQVKAEVERLRTSYVRTEQTPPGWFDRLLGRK